jgi:glycosyltransferase involved in cell wall biosynthesis/GT2 family glycosyltransferase
VPVLFDLQGTQSPAHGDRGIARYVLELALALERRHPQLVSRYLLDPHLPIPRTLEPLIATGKLDLSNRLDPDGAGVYHAASPFEYVQADRIWPPRARRLRLVVTLYDLIPKLFPEIYLRDPGARAWYLGRLELLRQADKVLAISETTARDAVEQLGVRPDRVVVTGTGVSARFRPPKSRDAALEELTTVYPWLEPGYVLFTGGIEPRKNIDRLLEAYAGLPEELRRRHQLVIVCRVLDDERARLDHRLRKLGVQGRVRFPGFVPDEDLVRFYQATELFVFPALYEGYGLPIAEAMASGAPVIASGTSSMAELVRDNEAHFDPTDTESIGTVLRRALLDQGLRDRLRTRELNDDHSWDTVADRTADVYEQLLKEPRRRVRHRTRVAFVSPLPPQRSGVADYSYRLLEELRKLCAVDAFTDADPSAVRVPSGVAVARAQVFHTSETTRGGYDAIIYALGNSEFHTAEVKLLRERPGIVLAHDVRLTGLYSWMAANRPDVEPRGFYGALQAMYGQRVPSWVGLPGGIDYYEADRYGIFMAREAIALSERFLVNSEYAAQLARLDAPDGHEHKVEVLGFGCPDPGEFPVPQRGRGPVVGTFGLVAPVKQIGKVIDAFAIVAADHPTVTLAVVGPAGAPGELERYRKQAIDLGIGECVWIPGELDDAEFRAAVAGAMVAVQLRASSNGESPASVADSLAAGVPTVVTSLGAAHELPDDCVVKVEPAVTPIDLANEITALLRAGPGRAAISRAGRAFAVEHSFARVAHQLYEQLTTVASSRKNERVGRAARMRSPRFSLRRPTVSVAIVAYGAGWTWLPRALDALARNTSEPIEVIVVDNGGADPDERRVDEDVTVIRSGENVGFGPASNRAAELACGDIVCFLNTDVLVEPGWLPPLVEATDEKGIGAVFPAKLNLDGTMQEAGAFVTAEGLSYVFGDGDNPNLPEHRCRREVDFGSAACMCLKRQVFMAAGGFDPAYRLAYFEDADLCFRLRVRGLRLVYEPRSRVRHARSVSVPPAELRDVLAANRRTFVDRWRTEIRGRSSLEQLQRDPAARIAARDLHVTGRFVVDHR